MSDIYQPSLFESPDKLSSAPVQAPSDEFAAAYPELAKQLAMQQNDRFDFDPNARRVEQLRNAGGGLAAAAAGEITFLPAESKEQALQESVDRHPSVPKLPFEKPGQATGRHNPGTGPVSIKEIRESRRGMSKEDIEAQRKLNDSNIADIRSKMGWHKKSK